MEQNNASLHLVNSKFIEILLYLDEKTGQIWAAKEARALGHGGVETVATATGIWKAGRSRPGALSGRRRAASGLPVAFRLSKNCSGSSLSSRPMLNTRSRPSP